MNKEDIKPMGLVYVPRYVKQESDMEYGSIVTHENYNEKLNLNTTQGDYNTEVLNLLFTECNPAKVHHIKYLDENIENVKRDTETSIIKLLNDISDIQEDVNKQDALIDDLNTTINNIRTGAVIAGKANEAIKITGVDTAPNRHYYGTDTYGNIGFHEIPDAIYARPIEGTTDVDGIYYVPRPDSVDETMLTEGVRIKLNRTAINSYNDLINKPYINGVEIVGSKTLSELGIQPAGNYLTSIPDNYATKSYIDTKLNDYETVADSTNTFATKTTVNALQNTVSDFQTETRTTYAKVCINTFEGTPKNGDILITL